MPESMNQGNQDDPNCPDWDEMPPIQTPHVHRQGGAFSGLRVRRRNKAIWQERCIPQRGMTAENLIWASIGFIAGISVIVFVTAASVRPASTADETAPGVRNEGGSTSHPLAKASLMRRVVGGEPDEVLLSEREEDSVTEWACAAWRLDTEAKLGADDMSRIQRLEPWRLRLGEYLDSVVLLARLETGGGSWADHELRRNDLACERFLALHAFALTETPAEKAGTAEPIPNQDDAVATDWKGLADEISKAAVPRIQTPEADPFWEEKLEGELENVSATHAALLPLIENLEIARTRDAVFAFCREYFRKTFPQEEVAPDGMLLPDAPVLVPRRIPASDR